MSTVLVDTFVAGLPKTKGSVTVRTNGTVTNSRRRADGTMDHSSSHWRALMAGAVRDSYEAHWVRANGPTTDGPPPHPGPVLVQALFRLPVDPLAYGAGDLDKLLRNLLDALGTTSKNPRYNGGVIVDDNQVVSILADKRMGPVMISGRAPAVGVHVVVKTLG